MQKLNYNPNVQCLWRITAPQARTQK